MKKITVISLSWLKKNNKIIKIITVPLVFIVSVITIYNFFFSDDDDKNNISISSTKKVIDSSSTNIDLSTNNTSTTNIYIEKTESKKPVDKTITYKFIGKSSIGLKKKIEKTSNIKIINNADNTIEISHTGQIKLLSKDSKTFIYTGGNIEVLINGSTCYNYKDFIISSMRPNSKEIIINNIQKAINNIVNQNIDTFSNKIIQCIKN